MGLVDLIFPKTCLGCGKPGKYVCGECVEKSPPAKTICPLCKKYSYLGQTHTFCAQKLSLNGLWCTWKYEGVVRLGITNMKYRFAHAIAGDLVEHIMPPDFNEEKPILVPVPLYKKREAWRGFNQAAILARKISEKTGWSYQDNLVLRIADSTPQAWLGRKERMQNIRGKFAVNRDTFDDFINSKAKNTRSLKRIIVVDDVWTTGATISELCRELKKAGAQSVWAMCVARG